MAEIICLSSSDEDERKVPKRKLSSTNNSSSSSSKKQKIEKPNNFYSPQPAAAASFCKDLELKKERKVIKPQLVVKHKVPIVNSVDENVFQNFVKLCLERRDDEDSKKVLQKLEKFYSKLSFFHKNDSEFRLFVGNCHDRIRQGIANDIFTPILDLRNEIKRRSQQQAVTTGQDEQQQNVTVSAEETVEVSKEDMKKIKVLESSIVKCTAKIKQLEEQEVDFDEDNDSAYIKEDKYKKRLLQLCNALSKITGDKVIRKQIMKRKIKRKDVPGEMTGISSVDQAILNFVNSDIEKMNQMRHLKTQRCADHIQMPEYLDVLECVQKCNNNHNLDLSKDKMSKLAKKAFQTVGNFLKKKRMDETKSFMQSLQSDHGGGSEIGTVEDPAMKDAQLNRKLQENKREGDVKLAEIFKKYVDIQEGLSKEDLEKQTQAVGSADEDDDGETSSYDDDAAATAAEGADNDLLLMNQEALLDDDEISGRIKSKTNGKEIIITTGQTTSSSSSSHEKGESDVEKEKNETNKGTEIVVADATAAATASIEDDVLVLSDTDFNCKSDYDKSDQDPLDISSSEKAIPANVLTQKSLDELVDVSTNVKKSFIKVCAFAKPPPAWSDNNNSSSSSTSPEKLKKKFQLPIQQALQDLPNACCSSSSTEYIDLTKETEKRPRIQQQQQSRLPYTTIKSNRLVNPLSDAAKQQQRTSSNQQCTTTTTTTSPAAAKRVVIVKNIINNYNVPLSADSKRSRRNDDGIQILSQNSNSSSSRTPWLSKGATTIKTPFIQ